MSRGAASVAVRELGDVTLGIAGARRNAAAALACDGTLLAFCEEERISRVRQAGLIDGALPERAISTVLQLSQRQRSDIASYAFGEDAIHPPSQLVTRRLSHHFAHATTGYLTSPFPHAAVLVCDRSAEQLSVWRGDGAAIVNCNWPRSAQGLADLYSECATLFGFAARQEHRLEGLARLDASCNDDRLSGCFKYADGRVVVDPGWKDRVHDWLGMNGQSWSPLHGARVAAAFQRALGSILLELIADIRHRTDTPNLCLCGGLFFNTFFNTIVSESNVFPNTFVAPNPGNTGIAAGAALIASRRDSFPRAVSPYLGPSFTAEEIKATLDNCKLSYDYLSEQELIDQVVSALTRGHLVGWFQGQMEWGPRALGNRSILASPQSAHVVENLNVFLKHRPVYTTYGVSVCEEDAQLEFQGPRRSAWMEYDFKVVDRNRFRHILPEDAQSLRVQTIEDSTSPLFARLHKAFGVETRQTGVLVNTSFNGFSEPIVCSPRDAIRVFYGTGLDLLAMGRFIIRK
jgi:carbamoyltransferase